MTTGEHGIIIANEKTTTLILLQSEMDDLTNIYLLIS